jgi:predicted SprT family Zn-dependent metalloprotease
MAPTSPDLLSIEWLQGFWQELNRRYFCAALPLIDIVWSHRLTSSAGMFVSRVGPRAKSNTEAADTNLERRLIRLSLPLMQQLSQRSPDAQREILSTLAHEMIHQWQFDVLKRRPNHGPDFLRKMTEINRDGLVGITIYHSLGKETQALAKYAWRCLRCGRAYERQRRTIRPSRHRCGACRGPLSEVPAAEGINMNQPLQLTLKFAMP